MPEQQKGTKANPHVYEKTRYIVILLFGHYTTIDTKAKYRPIKSQGIKTASETRAMKEKGIKILPLKQALQRLLILPAP